MSPVDDAWRLILKRTELQTTLQIISDSTTHGASTGAQIGERVMLGAIAGLIEILGEEATFNIITRAADGIGSRLMVNVPSIGKE